MLPKMFFGHSMADVEAAANQWLTTVDNKVVNVELALCGEGPGRTNYGITVVIWTAGPADAKPLLSPQLKLFEWQPSNSYDRNKPTDEQVRNWLDEKPGRSLISADLAVTGEYGLVTHVIAIAVLYTEEG